MHKSTHSSDDINDWHRTIFLVLVMFPGLLTDKGPQSVKVDCGFVVLVFLQMEVTHTNFAKVSRMAGERVLSS